MWKKAAQKIAYIAEEIFRENGVREKSSVTYYTPNPAIFAIPKYASSLLSVCAARGINVELKKNLIEVRNASVAGDKQEAIFKHMETGVEEAVGFDFLHVTPPMIPPAFIAESGLGNANGYVGLKDDHS
jgi:sulfide:quinone oxidoreductase